MIALRTYKFSDAEKVKNWITNEKAFRLWCADRFEKYPLSADEFNNIYKTDNTMQGFIAEDDGEAVGHLFIQDLGNSKYKFGLIIVDNIKRGKGYGRKMLECAIDYAKEALGACSVTLSVFDTNTSAYNCYKKLGFSETKKYTEHIFFDENTSI